ncbi:hypothetical protein CYLTODRAFT_105216 [Cylindrobasidium torrendii FP15055 ss-10]|uniref:Secreted protein n=1 Tax=Cylindrobasidium torrendii FP15055 ss-10 TaxID=1314674 RepID=A0A0D7BMG9_9AGAR|nr:hypothetical protein CYLTODRAFT_105216 [Cylindrobasidium torrendii FP15055 ss-10]
MVSLHRVLATALPFAAAFSTADACLFKSSKGAARQWTLKTIPQLYFFESQLQPGMMPVEYIHTLVPQAPRPSMLANPCTCP